MSKIAQIQSLVRYGLYYLTEHADEEAMIDELDIYDVENGFMTGKVRRTWPKEGKYEVVGRAFPKNTGTMYTDGILVSYAV